MYNFLKRAALSELVADPNFIKEQIQQVLNNYLGKHDPNSAFSNIKHGLGNWLLDIDNTSNTLAKVLPTILEAKKQQIAAKAGNAFENYFNKNVKGLDKLRFLVSKLGNSLGFDSATYAKGIEDKFRKAYTNKIQQEIKNYPMELFLRARTGQFNDPKAIVNYISTIKVPKTNSLVANKARSKVLNELNTLDSELGYKQASTTTSQPNIQNQQPQDTTFGQNTAPTAPVPPDASIGMTGGKIPTFKNNIYGNSGGSAHAENMQGNMAAANREAFKHGVSANHERFRHAVTDNKKYFSNGAGMGLTGKPNASGGFEYADVSGGLEGMAYNPNNLGYASAFNIPGQYNYGRRLKDLFKELEKNPNYTEIIKTKFGS